MKDREIRNYNGNCGPMAIQKLTGRLDGEVLDVCFAFGFSQRCGMTTINALKALRALSMIHWQCEVVDPVKKERVKQVQPRWRDIEKTVVRKWYGKIHRPKQYFRHYAANLTLGEFMKKFPIGKYLVVVERHFCVVENGVLFNEYSTRKKVHSAYQIEEKSLGS
jgi:hypothetical protein